MQLLTSQFTREIYQFRGRGIRFLLYCHDTFGLGHIRRALSLAWHFTTELPDAHVLIVTGSPFAHSYALPPRTDYVKMPAVAKQKDGDYRSRSLDLDFSSIRDLRATLLRETAQAYHPDVFLVDHAPQGLKREALSTLAMLRETQPECLRVLGQRDILDAGQAVRKTWNEDGVYETLENDYDLILVYGSPDFYDIRKEYALPEAVQLRVCYCGYLDRLAEEHAEESASNEGHHTLDLVEELFSASDHLVVVTGGGGGDGFTMMRAYLSRLREMPSLSFASLLLTGPFMPETEQRELHEMAAAMPAGLVHIESFLPNPLPFLRLADLVVTMAGYNTVCELLALHQRILLIPRAVPRQEQLIRASRLAQRGLVSMIHPDQLTPERLIDGVQQALLQPRPQKAQLDASGIFFSGQSIALEAIMTGLYRLPVDRWLSAQVYALATETGLTR